jgi:protein SCO1/2
MIHWRPTRIAVLQIVIVGMLSLPIVGAPIFPDESIDALEGVGITEHLDQQIPLNLTFVDEFGNDVLLSDFFDGEKPIIITLNYYRCPMLCSLTLNGLTTGMMDMEWTLGNEFDVVTISINPDEDAELAMTNKKGYVGHYDRVGAENGWHFLTGEQESITAIADSIGFGYVFDDKSGEFLHTATIIFMTPDGRISKYMNDVKFAAKDLRFALIEASEGRIGTALDTLLLFNCFVYDPDSNSYVPSAKKLMRTGGALMLLMLIGGLAVLKWTTPERLRAKKAHTQMDGNNS